MACLSVEAAASMAARLILELKVSKASIQALCAPPGLPWKPVVLPVLKTRPSDGCPRLFAHAVCDALFNVSEAAQDW